MQIRNSPPPAGLAVSIILVFLASFAIAKQTDRITGSTGKSCQSCPKIGKLPIDIGPTIHKLIEADWIEQDEEFASNDEFPLEQTSRLITKGCKLAERLRLLSASSSQLEPLVSELRRIEAGLRVWRGRPGLGSRAHLASGREQGQDALATSGGEMSIDKRRAVYFDVRGTIRRIAFCNPLLDFDRLLFIKRHHPRGVFHMCDQYYGFNAVPGGGLYVLSDPFGPDPKVIDLLADAVVENGRLKGRTLSPGGFLSPEVSYDGKTILFAYTEGKGQDLEWTPQSCYHIFKLDLACRQTGLESARGPRLVQLTDGPWDDFDPCFLPNGRIVFNSERRGGYLRCGRHCPTYALHSMAPDGSDIIRFSYHETHEWHPSVTNDGMVVYTRWDYVDRDTNIAHHIWTCFPDGRDPRSLHGNYPARRETQPWMEMSIRAIPGSHKFVATAAAHHGNAFGSLVMIDLRRQDDGMMSQLTRLTPDVPLPEAEKQIRPIEDCMVYGTAWPLSEDDYLCAYDRHAKNHGIYWMDRFGNKELIYRDPSIPCISPIPLRPRPKPPVIPSRTVQTAEDIKEAGGICPQETITVVNVYDSDFEWPKGAKVTKLRIIQVLPKTTPPPNEPRIGVADQTNARAVLGTVPVEADGSAHFEVPPGRMIYFQALDEGGMAIQSMRSGTYVHPGEQLSCVGCHEPKGRTATRSAVTPLALQRPPSEIEPGVDGSNPFNYVRLVQPVLDRNCVSCHSREKALDLTGVIEGKNGWTRSYNNLAEKYGFYFHVRNGSINTGIHGGSRTIAGQFGARAAGLLEFMDEQHYGVRLSQEDFHRLTLWLDCNSEFYGSYENTVAQAMGQVVQPTLD